jgi:predicted nuclease of restriction endonuclease-like (RecB) superfamily
MRQDKKLLESDLEHAIIARLQEFLLELGKGFSFVGRQQRITLETDHFYIDLIFYNRFTRSFVLIDLKNRGTDASGYWTDANVCKLL